MLWVIAVAMLAACVGMQGQPLQVTVADIGPLPSEGLEMRMNVKLRVQNPNEAPVDFDGVYVQLDVQGSTFATGVSNARGSIPRFGESVIDVPVTVSAIRVATQAITLLTAGAPADKVRYDLSGKLGGAMFGSTSFLLHGEFALPAAD
jgi:LEA14-like dessication related protein